MDVDRRSLLVGLGLTLTAACAQAGPNKSRQAGKGKGAKMAGSPLWSSFKAAFLDPSGRIIDNGNGGISHSEGQSYGLTFALWNDDRAAFDAILHWTETVLAKRDMALFAWKYDPCAPDPVGDKNNATDGDMLIAWTLAQAADQWGEPRYAERSAMIRAAIRSNLVMERAGRLLLLPGLQGFVTPTAVTLNPSYYIWPALDAFARLDGRQVWGQVVADGEAIMRSARFGPLNLPTDWIDINPAGTVVPAAGRAARFGFDAIRVPLYAHAGKRDALLPPIRQYWRGYIDTKRPIPAWVDVLSGEVAPYALSAGGMAVAANILGVPAPTGLSPDYYGASLQMLATMMR